MGARLDINSIFIANFEIIKFFKLIVIENGTVKIIVYGLQDFVTIALETYRIRFTLENLPYDYLFHFY